jgi:malonyl-ACP decarboxylase
MSAKPIPNPNNNLIKNMLKILRRSNKGMLSNAIAVLEAYNQSNLYDVNGDEVALIIAGNNTTQKLQYDLRNKFNEAPEYLTPTYAMQFMDTDILGTISEIFKITGEGFTVGGASASGNMGIIKGFQLLNAGSEEVCVVVGAMDDLSPMELQGLYNIGAMGGKKPSTPPESVCRPFDKKHDGFIYGQGTGCIILETLEHAKKRNAPILAEIKAGVINIDGNRLSNPNASAKSPAHKRWLCIL